MINRLVVVAALLLAFGAVMFRPALAAAPLDNVVLLDLKDGRVTILLRPDLAPKHVARVKQLVREHFYDGIIFHRVIPGFMAQTGDGQRGDGTGGSKYPALKAEFSTVPFTRGIVGMARTSDPNSANSQFFIMYGDAPSLNNQYTVIGQVVSGMEVVDKIKKGSSSNNGAVTDPDKIVKMTVAADAK
jgi:peptidylprolyl isomerase